MFFATKSLKQYICIPIEKIIIKQLQETVIYAKSLFFK